MPTDQAFSSRILPQSKIGKMRRCHWFRFAVFLTFQDNLLQRVVHELITPTNVSHNVLSCSRHTNPEYIEIVLCMYR
jgi:hypothetical protein